VLLCREAPVRPGTSTAQRATTWLAQQNRRTVLGVEKARHSGSTCVCMCVCVCVCVCLYVCVYVCVHARNIPFQFPAYTQTCTQTYTHTLIYTHTHLHTRTDTHNQGNPHLWALQGCGSLCCIVRLQTIKGLLVSITSWGVCVQGRVRVCACVCVCVCDECVCVCVHASSV
jgi:hypothetical protein